jgi:pyruvate dehydrogenase E2 component (dihydrolipoyllysine-residue acetyltransferase)
MSDVIMPRLSDTMEEGVLSRWVKHEGDPVGKGDVLAEIETDKAVMELEAYDAGVLAQVLVPEGSTVPIGTPIAVIGTTAGTQPPTQMPSPATVTPDAVRPDASAASDAGTLLTSPLARSIARRHGIDLSTVTGTGPGGRIVRADIQAIADRQESAPRPTPATAAEPTAPQAARRPPSAPAAKPRPVTAQPPPAGHDTQEVPLSRVRRLTAERLTESARQAPHFYLTRAVDADALLALRQHINDDMTAHASAETAAKISVTDLLIKASAQALTEHPEVNSSWARTRLLRHRRVHIGVAVALDDGLIVPVIHDADTKSVRRISREARDLAQRARAGRLALGEITGGTFTISNLGMYGIDQFTAVINPPEAAVLAVGAAAPAPAVRDRQLIVRTTMVLTLSIDHRVLDGATGALFLADLTALLEHPLRILL